MRFFKQNRCIGVKIFQPLTLNGRRSFQLKTSFIERFKSNGHTLNPKARIKTPAPIIFISWYSLLLAPSFFLTRLFRKKRDRWKTFEVNIEEKFQVARPLRVRTKKQWFSFSRWIRFSKLREPEQGTLCMFTRRRNLAINTRGLRQKLRELLP